MAEVVSRRSFLKLAATASAAAALPGCEPAARKLIPYVVPDENVIPGVPSFFATTCSECPAGCGVEISVSHGDVYICVGIHGRPAIAAITLFSGPHRRRDVPGLICHRLPILI